MPTIRLHGFTGIAPKLDPVFLRDHQAQVAINSRLDGGALRAWRTNKDVATLALAGEVKTIYRVPGGEWLQFNQDVDIVKSQLADDATDRHYYTGTGELRVTDNTLIDIGGNDEYPESSYAAGVQAPASAPVATLQGTHSNPQETAYVYTFVNDWGEESAPSAVSNIVLADLDTGTVELTNLEYLGGGDRVPINKWRIYRVSVGVTGADYLFVAEVTTTLIPPQYTDNVANDALGEPLPTEDWDYPPAGMIGLTEMPNGMMAGFVDNKVYICEPYIPYAYPDKYSFTVPVNIVGLGSFGNTLLVMTESNPYAISGTTPESMSMAKLPYKHPCLSRRGIVNFERGVGYPSPDGVFYIGEDGVGLITEKYYTRNEWLKLNPAAGFATRYDESYVIFLPSIKQGMILDKEAGPIFLNIDADAAWVADKEDKLFIAIYDLVELTTGVYEFNAGGSNMVYTWRSKKFIVPQLTAMTSCKLNADFDATLTAEEVAELQAERDALEALNDVKIAAGDVCGDINGSMVNEYPINGDCLYVLPVIPEVSSYVLRIYGDGNLLVEQAVSSVKPFRVPISEKLNEYEIEISGQYPVRDVVLATSIRELKALAR